MYSHGALVASALAPDRASQAPRLIIPRALSPTTPEGPLAAYACCFTNGLSGFILVGGLATFVFLSRPNRVHLRYGSRVRLTSPPAPLLGLALIRLRAEQAIYTVNSFQFTRSARLILAYPTSGRHAERPDCHCFSFLRKVLTVGFGPFQSCSRLSRVSTRSRLSRASARG
jgi:hypothetical protein